MGAYLRRAEDLGFESAMLIDHLLVAPPAYRVTWLEPITLLAALSGVTRTIRLGTLVLVLPFRDPVAFAKEWATLDQLSGGRTILGVGVGWNREEFAALRIPIEERGRRMNEMLESITALWAGDDVSYEGQLLPLRAPDDRAQARPEAAPADLDRRRHAAVREDLRPGRRHDPAGPAADREVRRDMGAALERDRRDGRRRLGRPSAATWSRTGATRTAMGRVYSNFVHVLKPGEQPESAAAKFRVYSGMDLPYWQEFYLLGEAEAVAERIRGKIEALGGVDHLILNPLDWDPANLDVLAERVLPLVVA